VLDAALGAELDAVFHVLNVLRSLGCSPGWSLGGRLDADLDYLGWSLFSAVCATFGFSLCSAVYGWTFQPGVRVSQVFFFRQVHSASPM